MVISTGDGQLDDNDDDDDVDTEQRVKDIPMMMISEKKNILVKNILSHIICSVVDWTANSVDCEREWVSDSIDPNLILEKYVRCRFLLVVLRKMSRNKSSNKIVNLFIEQLDVWPFSGQIVAWGCLDELWDWLGWFNQVSTIDSGKIYLKEMKVGNES